MQPYKDRDGDSGVSAYDIAPGSISIQFKDGSLYLYSYASAGSSVIETMKQLAASGDGLNAYINRNVKKNYASKLR